MTPIDWGHRELDAQRREARRFPIEPDRGTRAWVLFAEMKRARARRRKAMGFSRAEAAHWVASAAAELGQPVPVIAEGWRGKVAA